MKARRRIFATLTVTIVLVVGLGAGEVAARLKGLSPWTQRDRDPDAALHMPDATLGWRLKPGRHEEPPLGKGGQPYQVTILPGFEGRDTGGGSRPGQERIAFVGGSFTFGAGVPDHEAYPARVQARLAKVKVLNLGTSAYGTYQSLLLLEELLKGPKAPKLVVYGFSEWHLARNVAEGTYLGTLAWSSPSALVPYCTLDETGKLTPQAPTRWQRWFLSDRSALVNWAQQWHLMNTTAERSQQAGRVTGRLLIMMQELCQARGVKLHVAFLMASPSISEPFEKILRLGGVATIVDCNRPITEDLHLPGDPHPNAKLHQIYADAILEAIAEDVDAIASGSKR